MNQTETSASFTKSPDSLINRRKFLVGTLRIAELTANAYFGYQLLSSLEQEQKLPKTALVKLLNSKKEIFYPVDRNLISFRDTEAWIVSGTSIGNAAGAGNPAIVRLARAVHESGFGNWNDIVIAAISGQMTKDIPDQLKSDEAREIIRNNKTVRPILALGWNDIVRNVVERPRNKEIFDYLLNNYPDALKDVNNLKRYVEFITHRENFESIFTDLRARREFINNFGELSEYTIKLYELSEIVGGLFTEYQTELSNSLAYVQKTCNTDAIILYGWIPAQYAKTIEYLPTNGSAIPAFSLDLTDKPLFQIICSNLTTWGNNDTAKTAANFQNKTGTTVSLYNPELFLNKNDFTNNDEHPGTSAQLKFALEQLRRSKIDGKYLYRIISRLLILNT